MDFSLTDDRRMLAETLDRFFSSDYPVEHRVKVAYDAPYHDPDKWAALSELGALYALAPEEAGGMGGTGFDISVVFEAMGRVICPEPVLGTLMAARLLSAAGEDLSELLDGSKRYAVAISEPDAPYDLDYLECSAKDGKLSGRKTSVYGGNDADVILVACKGGSVWAVENAPVTGYGMMDGGGAAELLLDDTPGTLVLEDGRAALEDAVNAGIVALCSEAVGAMETTHAITLDYMRQRKQFGVPIGKFQALQHRAVDMLTEIEQARSITIKAASELGGDKAGLHASMAKELIGRAARLIAEESIQMHGGIAMTWEYPVSHYAKRLVMIDHQLGDTDHHLARVAESYAA